MTPTHKELDQTRKNRLRAVLFLCIGAVLVTTATFQYMISQRRNDAAEAEANLPERRAQLALVEADRSAAIQDVPAARQHVIEAKAALDEGLAERPDDVKLQRARVTVARRLAYLAQAQTNEPEARQHMEDAAIRAKALFDAEPNGDRARTDRLTTAHELARVQIELKDAKAAVPQLSEAIDALDATSKTLSLSAALNRGLSTAQLTLARAHTDAGDPEGAIKAADAGIARAEKQSKADLDPIGDLASLSGALASGAAIAKDAKRPADVLRFDRRQVEVLTQRHALSPNDDSLVRARATRLVRIGDAEIKAKNPDAARVAYEAAVEARGMLSAKKPKDSGLRAAWIRALSRLGLFHSNRGENKLARANYEKAVKAAELLPGHEARTRLLALGNWAHILGRMDEMVESKAVAKRAFDLANGLRGAAPKKKGKIADAAVAALRHARLLRAKPKPQRAEALKVAKDALVWLDGIKKPGQRATATRTELESLIKELK